MKQDWTLEKFVKDSLIEIKVEIHSTYRDK
jgi:hypothetical protein